MVKDDITSSRMEDLESECEILWVKIEIASCKPLHIASYYRPNHSDAESLEQPRNSHIWLAGDINFPNFVYNNYILIPNEQAIYIESCRQD